MSEEELKKLAKEYVDRFDLPEEVEGFDKALGLEVYKMNHFGRNMFIAGYKACLQCEDRDED